MRRGLLIAALVLCVAHEADAQEPARHALRWTRAPGAEACIDAPALTAAVEARLGRTVFVATDAAVVIEAHVQPRAPGWHVAIAVRSDDGQALGMRELDEPAADCRVLDDALVLMIALIVDPEAALRPAPPIEEPTRPPPTPPTPPLPPPPSPRPAAPSAQWRFEASAAIATAGLLLPGIAVGAAARVSIDPPGLPTFAIRGTWWREDELRDRDQGSSLDLATGGIAVCVPIFRTLLSTCAGLDLGRLAGNGFGFDRSQHASAVVAYFTVEPTVAVELTPWLALSATLGAWLPFVRPRFVYDQAGMSVLLYQPPPIAVVGQAGLVVRF